MKPLRRARPVAVGALCLFASLPAQALALSPSTVRVSVSSSGAQSDVTKGSFDASVSADGRFIAFVSTTTNFAPGDTNGKPDVFLRDRKTGTTTRISLSTTGAQSDASSIDGPRISADGRYVVFRADASTLAPGTTAGVFRLYRYDRAAGALTLVPLPAGGTEVSVVNPMANPRSSSISADGSRIAFRSIVSGIGQVWWWDATTGLVRRASETAASVAGDGTGSFDANISGNGRFVAFASGSKNLVAPANPSYRDVFVKNLDSGAIERVSDVLGGSDPQANLHSSTPALSYDGCIAAFFSDATNLVATDSLIRPKVFARDRCGGSGTSIMSYADASATTQLASATPISISDNGCRVVFLKAAGAAVLMRDRCKGTTDAIDVPSGFSGSSVGGVRDASISGGTGRYVVFTTTSDQLSPDDTNGAYDVYLRDLADNTPPVATLTTQVAGTRVQADGTTSHDPDGWVLTGSINWGDGSPSQAGLTGVHDYTRPGTYSVTLTVTDADGVSTTTFAPVTVTPADGGNGGGGNGTPGGGAPALVLDRVSLAKSRFVAGARRDSRHGTTLTLRLNLPATLTLTFDRATTGRRVKGVCKSGARRGARCTSYKRGAALTRVLPAGKSSIAISGSFGRKRLRAGRYRLTVRARTSDGRIAAAKALTVTVTTAKKRKGK